MDGEHKNPWIEGNIFWLYEAFKTENQELDFNRPYTDNPQSTKDILIYECLMFNDDREDSIFIMQKGILYEYFSENKYELLLKIIQYYENRMTYNSPYLNRPDDPPVFKTTEVNKVLQKKFKLGQEFSDPEAKFKTKVRANVFLVFKDGTRKWVYNYELKKLLFYLKFLPRAKDIKLIRLFPPSVKELEIKILKYIDREDRFVETKEEQLQMDFEMKNDDQMLTSFVKKIKTVFYDKYLLNLKKVDIEVFKLEEQWYVLDMKNFLFEKYENKHIKLDSEGLFFRYVEKYKDKALMIRDNRKLKDVKIFFDAMMNKYDELFHHIVSDEYLDHPDRDKTSDKAFMSLNPQCNYYLSELMKPNIGLRTFVSNATDNLWNQDDGRNAMQLSSNTTNKQRKEMAMLLKEK